MADVTKAGFLVILFPLKNNLLPETGKDFRARVCVSINTQYNYMPGAYDNVNDRT